MAGKGRAPKDPAQRRRTNTPARGEWTATPGHGWQHGPVPPPPPGLSDTAKDVWGIWFRSWFAAYWTPDDLPGIYLVVALYDAVQAGALTRSAELRIQMDAYGMTPKGQQDRRWKRPEPTGGGVGEGKAGKGGHYGRLRAVAKDTPPPDGDG